MTRYLIRRLLQLVPVVALALAVNFALVHLAPGDPVYVLAGDHGSEAYYAEMRAKFGLDRPLPEQLLRYAWGAVQGDFGYSFTYGQPVLTVIAEHLPATLLLMLSAQALALALGLSLGVVAGAHAGSPLGNLLRGGAALGYALPSFWVGQLLILFLAYQLDWFPVYGMETLREGFSGWRRLLDVGHHLVLPVVALSLVEAGIILRLTATAVHELAGEEFVRTARAKGLSTRVVLTDHVLRNALLPVATVVGQRVGTLLSGAVLVEIVFAWPGLGRLFYNATLDRDYPLLMAMFLITALGVTLANLITDLGYVRLDPRVAYD